MDLKCYILDDGSDICLPEKSMYRRTLNGGHEFSMDGTTWTSINPRPSARSSPKPPKKVHQRYEEIPEEEMEGKEISDLEEESLLSGAMILVSILMWLMIAIGIVYFVSDWTWHVPFGTWVFSFLIVGGVVLAVIVIINEVSSLQSTMYNAALYPVNPLQYDEPQRTYFMYGTPEQISEEERAKRNVMYGATTVSVHRDLRENDYY